MGTIAPVIAKQLETYRQTILTEITQVLQSIDETQVHQLITAILVARRIVLFGAGRMGMVSTGFAMRLGHLGFDSHYLTEMTSPNVSKQDLLILSSGSGETEMVYSMATVAKKSGVKIALITSRPDSRIGKLADLTLKLDFPNKVSTTMITSIQPMTTLAEQSLMLFFDLIVLMLMDITEQSTEDLWQRHNNLE